MTQQFHLWEYTQKNWIKILNTYLYSQKYHSQQLNREATQVSINRWMDNQNVVYIIHITEYNSALKEGKFLHISQHEWALRTLC